MSVSDEVLADGVSPFGEFMKSLWIEILGAEIDPARSFLDNGGDSFRAVQIVNRVFEETGRELDYLDVLEARSPDALGRLVAASPSER
ncbi:acyl carrier protein [Streptomyces sp. NPDC001941]|uniref:acyl carrier protein n=1 Tax=Streptomyces sp. NPDC001941 TaxID=3154659 RepID=UPI00331CE8FA